MKFSELDLNEQILESISYMGFDKVTPIQEQAIPIALEGKDLIACAQTGTGKTAAFVIPVLNKLSLKQNKKGINTLIIVPTRELAKQIDQQVQGFSYFLPVTSMPVYGGGDGCDFDAERKAFTSDTDFIIATPGRLISHLNMGYIDFSNLEHLILDEADKMLDMGFFEDIIKIVKSLPKKRQTMMFSATMPPKIRKLAGDVLENPAEINIELSKPAAGVLQAAYLLLESQKIPLINKLIIDKEYVNSILIFASTKKKINDIVKGLKGKGYGVDGISSDLDQSERENVLSRFKSKQTRVLVATDLLSRGIDIKEIQLIINFDVPQDAEDYVHRVGRTARASASGIALTLVTPDDIYRFSRIEKLIEKEISKIPLPAEIGESPSWEIRKERKHFKHKRKSKGKNKTDFKSKNKKKFKKDKNIK
ncbi:MAG: DEAD/DEAH box helicase [Bacteroidota bacterium]